METVPKRQVAISILRDIFITGLHVYCTDDHIMTNEPFQKDTPACAEVTPSRMDPFEPYKDWAKKNTIYSVKGNNQPDTGSNQIAKGSDKGSKDIKQPDTFIEQFTKSSDEFTERSDKPTKHYDQLRLGTPPCPSSLGIKGNKRIKAVILY